MLNYNGKAYFCEDGTFSKSEINGYKFVIAKGLCENAGELALDSGIWGFIFANFPQEKKQELNKNQFLGIDLDKKSIEDMFRNFQNKETDCSIIEKEDGTFKIKLISGSLSKSYAFNLNDNDRSLLENPNWIGNKN